ncbi:MAG: UDP-4-amino-4,6-dideoxy-N-acetyl-beta-L-altrosamine N-acetyltransferase [Methylophaga sp.]|nr:MAG: UDP-4-amino-4,6-dideoxy-N-acetyl-beta-L-altrosamine N-acetyltransferase [Methylophaga sp.]
MKQELREMVDTDLDKIRYWRNHPSVNKYMCTQKHITVDDHIKWFNSVSKDSLHHVFIYEEDTKEIGFVHLKQRNEQTLAFEWGFYIDPKSEKGTGTRMLQFVIKKVFNELKGHKIFGEVLDFNQSSIRLHQRLGFKQEGILKEHHVIDNNYCDIICFGLLKNM